MVKSVKAIILASVMVSMSMMLINSCGVNSPTGSQTSSSTIPNSTKSGILSIPFVSKNQLAKITFSSKISEASSPLVISWDSYPQVTSYNLYYSDIPHFVNTKVVKNVSSPYIFNIESQEKNYYFFITGIINGEEEKISGEFFSMFKGKLRYNVAPSFSDLLKNSTASSSASQAFLPSAYVGGSQYPTVPIQGPLTMSLNLQHAAKFSVALEYWYTTDLNATYCSWGSADWILDPVYGGPSTFSMEARWNPNIGDWDVVDAQFSVSNNSITCINNNPQAAHYAINGLAFDGITGFLYGFHREVFDPVAGTLEATMNGQSLVRFDGVMDGQQQSLKFNLIDGNQKKKKLKSIAITPDNATIYIHHSDPAKREQQYTAMGTYDDNGTITKEDVTKSVGWSSSRPDRATMDTVSIGKAIVAIVPGVTDIKAAALLPPPDDIQSNILKLNVQCWDSKYWSQVDMMWRNLPYARYPKIGAAMDWKVGTVYKQSIGALGCNLVCHSMMIRTSGTWSQPDTLNKEMLKPSTTKPKSTYYMVNDVDPDTVKDFSNGAITEVVPTTASGIKPELDNCNFLTAQVQSSTGCGHWVFITGQEGDNFTVYDPLRGIVTRTLGDFCGQVWVARTK